jgi:hypothetical protein
MDMLGIKARDQAVELAPLSQAMEESDTEVSCQRDPSSSCLHLGECNADGHSESRSRSDNLDGGAGVIAQRAECLPRPCLATTM